MNLIITEKERDSTLGEYALTFKQFADKSYHPFLAANKWDTMQVELNDNTPLGLIRQVSTVKKIVPIFDKENITPKVLSLLCEILPECAGTLRRSYSMDREDFQKQLNEISSMRGW